MSARRVVTASAAALMAVALSVPIVSAQTGGDGPDGSATGSLDLGSLVGGGGESGSLPGGSGEGSGSGGVDDGDAGQGGSLDTASAEDSSVGDLAPESEATCELPDLGGSVAKFYPLFGISGVPTAVLDFVTSALGTFPNLLDVLAGPGGGANLVGQTGSLTEPLCTAVFGGEMVQPPVTVIVDGDGNPVTTVTGTVAPGGTGSAGAGSLGGGSGAPTSTSSSSSTLTSGPVGQSAGDVSASRTGAVALPTSVPTPGA
ncbi:MULTISPECIES: hypothetical protein [unclassified Dietzia]|uniref:hypothetical protein n=1 Tax=unclassified Dietzia TaxID=2617939 RepID=UPI000D2281FD|nr:MULTISPECIES: hypothetical protein [unclassified Dietzia]AVZ40155.1 hypothetical protein CT688_12455 [Dietzia sp. JS16-p6b]QGW25597.1 hypothetical protein GJR88_03957 [Dietzia sp. DQ12-45-1b]